jgi:putative ABC transport system permease protein
MDGLVQDLRYAYRTLRRSPGFTATALAVLAIGIGATTSIYSIVRAVALRPLRFEEPDRLVFIGERSPAGRAEPVAAANLTELAAQSRTFQSAAMHLGTRFVLTGRAVPETLIGTNVSSAFFSVLRVKPQHGRTFLPDDEHRARAAVLSHSAWERHFSRDPVIVGQTITLDGIDHRVVGVLRHGFSLWDTDVWVAGFDRALLENRAAHNLGAIGRLADGVSLEQARVELDTIGRRLASAYPATNAGWTFRAIPLQEAWLGAAPSQLSRAILREGLTLTLVGVAFGVVGAFGAVRLIAHNLYGVRETDPIAFTVVPCLLLVVAGMASFVPARRASRVDPLVALHHE